MHYVYLIKSIQFTEILYVGYATNLEERFQKRNEVGSTYTAKYRPFEFVVYLCFYDESKAREFERYLKTQSGRAFAEKSLW